MISGFLVSRSIFDRDFSGVSSVVAFLRRRVSRLFPAFAVMLFVVTMMSWAILVPGIHESTLVAGVAGLLVMANIPISTQLGNYFGGDAGLYPIMHIWSLSVEEQLYIGFALLVLASYKISGKKNFWNQKHLWIGLIAISYLAYLFGAQIQGLPGSSFFGYFSPVIRVWQFGLGVLVYILFRSKFGLSGNSKTASWFLAIGSFGLGVLVLANLLGTPPNQVWVTALSLSSTLVIYGSSVGQPVKPLTILTWLGDRSYSIYLWHWPVISIYARFDLVDWFLLEIALLTGASLFLGDLSYRFIERRRLDFPISRRVATRMFSHTLGLAAVTSLAIGAMSLEAKRLSFAEVLVDKDLSLACSEYSDPYSCKWQVAPNGAHLVLIGDSNAGMVASGLIAAKDYLPLASLEIKTAAGCSGVAWSIRTNSPDPCDSYYEWVLAKTTMEREQIFVAAVSIPRINFNGDNPHEIADQPQIQNIKRFQKMAQKHGHRVILIEQAPKLIGSSWDVKECRFRSVIDGLCNVSVSMEEATKGNVAPDSYISAADIMSMSTVSFADLVCRKDSCHALDLEGKLVFEDQNHFEKSYLAKYGPEIASKLAPNID